MTNIDTSNIENPETNVKPVLDAQGRSYATGKRKNAVARVWIKSGSGNLSTVSYTHLTLPTKVTV